MRGPGFSPHFTPDLLETINWSDKTSEHSPSRRFLRKLLLPNICRVENAAKERVFLPIRLRLEIAPNRNDNAPNNYGGKTESSGHDRLPKLPSELPRKFTQNYCRRKSL